MLINSVLGFTVSIIGRFLTFCRWFVDPHRWTEKSVSNFKEGNKMLKWNGLCVKQWDGTATSLQNGRETSASPVPSEMCTVGWRDAPWLQALAVLPEELGLIPSIHVVVQIIHNSCPRGIQQPTWDKYKLGIHRHTGIQILICIK